MSGEATSLERRCQPVEDHDEPYTWGRPPSTYLSLRQVVRMSILRSRLGSTSPWERLLNPQPAMSAHPHS